MESEIKIRCDVCGKVIAGKSGGSTKCPRCFSEVKIPDQLGSENREYPRFIINESKLIVPLDENFMADNESALFRVMYSEAPPVDIAKKRKGHAALLDMSLGGIGLIFQKDNVKHGNFTQEQTIQLEIDFPILILPLTANIQIRWIKEIQNGTKMYKMGGQFVDSSKKFQDIIGTLIEYIKSRPDVMEVSKWAAF